MRLPLLLSAALMLNACVATTTIRIEQPGNFASDFRESSDSSTSPKPADPLDSLEPPDSSNPVARTDCPESSAPTDCSHAPNARAAEGSRDPSGDPDSPAPQASLNPQEATDSHPSAGALVVDLTPPPGMPMGGYTDQANRGRGFRTRIKARVLYLNDGQGQAMALVQTDWISGSLLVHHLVAAKVAKATGLRPQDIAITASHTHSAPANFFDNDFYNKHTSSGRWLAQKYLNFAVEQISEGIIQAYQQRRPAQVAIGKSEIYGLSRNRSLAAYLRNENAPELDPKDPESVFKAVNPELYMIRVDAWDDDGSLKPLAAFSGFSMHNTTLNAPVQVYNADVYAYPQRELAWEVKEKSQPSWTFVHAMTQASHGDVAPAIPDRGDNWVGLAPVDWVSSRRLGLALSEEVIRLFHQLEERLRPKLSLATAARELNIRADNSIGDIEICQNASVGAALVGGAYERRTPWLTLFPMFHGGNWLARRQVYTDGCQGEKRHLASSLIQPLFEAPDSFPQVVMFQLLKINDMVILPLPFEASTESGRRIAQRVRAEFAAAGREVEHVWVASTSNGYFGYTTTPEEYSHQNYEGGHTLYGKHSTPYLAARCAELARDHLHDGEVVEMLPEWSYELKTREYLADERPAEGTRSWLSLPQAVLAKKEREEDYVRVRWLDVNESQIALHQPLLSVQQRVDGKWQTLKVERQPLNDEGYDLELRLLGKAPQGMSKYEARWYNPHPGGEYRLVIAAREGWPQLLSPAFRWEAGGAVTLVEGSLSASGSPGSSGSSGSLGSSGSSGSTGSSAAIRSDGSERAADSDLP